MGQTNLYAEVADRLSREPVDHRVERLVLGAFSGDLSSETGGSAEPPPTDETPTSRGAYLTHIAVEGFRGVGPSATLELKPGPGLTLVVGRNGSGKSSFAEALEVVLTGDSFRWAGRTKIWREGWRNLHHASAAIAVGVAVEGEGTLTLQRTWDDDAELDDAATEIVRSGQKPKPLSTLGWTDQIDLHRPLLSYNELGSMLDEGPSKLYDALSRVLGLDALVEAAESLRQARLGRERGQKEATNELNHVRALLEASDDERAKRCLVALETKTWDLDVVTDVLAGTDATGADDDLDLLRALSSTEGPNPTDTSSAAQRLRDAVARHDAVATTDAGRARTTATLLEQALVHHETHGDEDCPVCGSGRLDDSWRTATQQEVDRLRVVAADAEDAETELKRALDHAKTFFAPMPEALQRSATVGVDADDTVRAWKSWLDVPEEHSALANHLADCAALAAALEDLKARAATELDRREDAWRPIAQPLALWVEQAREAVQQAELVPDLKAAEKWLKDATGQIRDDRFAPIGGQAQEFWEMLRQQSNVQLGAVELEGSGPRRRVTLDVSVDGSEGSALGVMSQGELNSLALSLFLPRATLEQSPFRFVVIDDPVQSMDPTKVDGLARVLERTARDRQVVVFTHDARLADAVRRLGIEATQIEITRRLSSVVELREALDPARRYLDDAFALADEERLPPKAASRVIPGLLRHAIEAACADIVWSRGLSNGEPHEDVATKLESAQKLTQIAALALFDDVERAGEVLRTLNSRCGKKEADAYQRCNKGAHEGYTGNALALARDTESLIANLPKAAT